MKKLTLLRTRGFTLIEITLVLAVGLGLIVGGLMFFQQAQTSSEVTDKTRALVSISSEVRAQYRSKTNLYDLNDPASGGVATGTTTGAAIAATPFGVRSGLAAATFNDVMTLEAGYWGDFNEFMIKMEKLDVSVCKRLVISDLGPKSSATCTTMDLNGDGNITGELWVTYQR